MSKSEILETLSGYLQDMFEVPAENIKLSALWGDILNLDSIDTIHLVAKPEECTGKKTTPSEFNSVRTISDVVENVHAQLS